jgi:hypothetical protein
VLEGCGNRLALVAAALNEFVVRDPWLQDLVMDTQDAIKAELPGGWPPILRWDPF